jgi:hypothetical protein
MIGLFPAARGKNPRRSEHRKQMRTTPPRRNKHAGTTARPPDRPLDGRQIVRQTQLFTAAETNRRRQAEFGLGLRSDEGD